MDRSVGIVVPAYDPDVDRLVAYLGALREELDPDILRVELDVPDEETLAALEGTAATVNAVQRRRGKGGAVTDGFDALETAVLAFADADGSTPATSMADVLDPVVTGRAAVAVGSRRHPEATVRSHQTVLRQHLGDVFAWLARRFLSVRLSDYQCGAKAIDGEAWTSLRDHVTETGFAWDVEVLGIASGLGLAIEEVPVEWEDHPDSTVSTVEAVPELLGALVSVRRRSRRLDKTGHTPEEDRPGQGFGGRDR
ncbi:MAG: glycosyltransferase [Halodesulfurarchaeum sp.]